MHGRRGEVVQGETRQSYVAAGNSPEVPAGSIPGALPRPTCHWPGSGKWFNAISQPAGGCMLWSPPTLSSQESDMSQKKKQWKEFQFQNRKRENWTVEIGSAGRWFSGLPVISLSLDLDHHEPYHRLPPLAQGEQARCRRGILSLCQSRHQVWVQFWIQLTHIQDGLRSSWLYF